MEKQDTNMTKAQSQRQHVKNVLTEDQYMDLLKAAEITCGDQIKLGMFITTSLEEYAKVVKLTEPYIDPQRDPTQTKPHKARSPIGTSISLQCHHAVQPGYNPPQTQLTDLLSKPRQSTRRSAYSGLP